MRTFKKIANWIRDSKGVATSLIEATATVAATDLAAIADLFPNEEGRDLCRVAADFDRVGERVDVAWLEEDRPRVAVVGLRSGDRACRSGKAVLRERSRPAGV